MIRANLLPQTHEAKRLFGIALDGRYLKAAAFALAAITLVALGGTAVEELRLRRLERAAVMLEDALTAKSGERRALERLALDVARYQEFAREATAFRDSGADAAIRVARIGNLLPADVWLDSIERDDGGLMLSGGSRTVDALGRTIATLQRSLPYADASLLSIENRTEGRADVHFRARVASAASPPATTVP